MKIPWCVTKALTFHCAETSICMQDLKRPVTFPFFCHHGYLNTLHQSWPETAEMLQVRKSTVLLTLCLVFCSWMAVCGLNITAKCVQDTVTFLTELRKSQPDKYAVLSKSSIISYNYCFLLH